MDKEDVVNIYTMEYYSAIKKYEVMPFAATWMDPEITILSKVCQTEKDKHTNHLYVESKKNDTNEPIYKRETGTSLVVQQLRIRASIAGCLGSIPGQGNGSCMAQQRSHMWQQRSCMLQLRPGAAK